MTDLKYEYGSCLPSNFHLSTISPRDSPQLRSDSSSPLTVTSPNRGSWGSDGERVTSSSDGEKTRSSPDEHFYSHESSCEQALGASVRSDDVDGGLLCNSMEYLGLDVKSLYPESGRAQWPMTSPESQKAGSPNTDAAHHSVGLQQNDNARTTSETLRTLQPIHASYNGFTDSPAIANENHKDLYSVNTDTTFQRTPPVPNLSNSVVRTEQTMNQTLPKLETTFPTQTPLFPSLPKPGTSLVPYPPIAHPQPTYQGAQNVPYASEANKRMQEVMYPQLYQRNFPPPLKEPEINDSIQMQNSFNITNTFSDSGFQELGNRACSRVLNKNVNHVSENYFSPRAPIEPEVRPSNVPPSHSNLAAPPQRAATSSSHFKGNYPLPDVSLPPPKYNKPDAHFARPKNPPKRAVVGRPVVGRPPVSLPGENTAVQCSDQVLLRSIVFAQLNVSWDTLYQINTLNDGFHNVDEFEDIVKVHEESSAQEDMGSYVRRRVSVKEAREARRLPEHERQERLNELTTKLQDEQASLALSLATGGKNTVWASPPSKHQKAPSSIASATSDKETSTNNISLLGLHDPGQQEETIDSEHIKKVSHTEPNHKLLKIIDLDNEIYKRLGKVEAQHARSSGPHLCTFCRQNGETEEFYSSHNLKDAKGKIICPTLRAFVCPFCRATGASAHTSSYCPQNPNSVRVKHSPHKKNRDGFTRYSHGLKYMG